MTVHEPSYHRGKVGPSHDGAAGMSPAHGTPPGMTPSARHWAAGHHLLLAFVSAAAASFLGTGVGYYIHARWGAQGAIGATVVLGLLAAGVATGLGLRLVRNLRESQEETHAVLETAVDAIIVIDADGTIRSFNGAAERTFGFGREEVIGQKISALMPSPYREEHAQYLENYLRTGHAKIIGIGREVQGRRKDGTTFPVDLAVSELRRGGRRAFIGVARDISERKNSERALIQAEKLSSIGMLAAGVAHEINNPLSGVMGCVKSLREGTVAPDKRDGYFATAQDGLKRIHQVVRGLLDYARQRPPRASLISIAEMVEVCLRLADHEAGRKQLEMRCDVSADVQVEADRAQLMQAFLNVLLNAIYAAPKGSAITTAIRRRDRLVGISLCDAGPGMSAEEIARACDPFYTTKPEGMGTGLGLAITLGIARAHGGELQIESEKGQGTCVTLWLPAPGGAHA